MNTATMAPPDNEREGLLPTTNSVDKDISPKRLVLPFINFILIVGPKGGGKTSFLVRFAIVAHFLWRVAVYSDFPIAGMVGGKYFEALPLPPDVFMNYGHGIAPGSVLIVDELQEFFDRQNWQQVAQKFGTSMAQQIRHLRLVVVGAMQYINYLNPRINDQIDLMIRCQDLRFTEWGITSGIARGKESILHWFDLCGGIDIAGSARNPFNPHIISGPPYKQTLFYMKAYREYFDTTRLTAIEQRFRQYQIKKEKFEVPRPGSMGEPEESIIDLIRICLDDSANEGKEKVSVGQLLGKLKDRGKEMSAAQLGRLTSQMGVERTLKQGRAFYDTGLGDITNG